MELKENKTVLAIVAHPDDAEFLCAGTLTLLHRQGWQVHIATMTPGDCGSAKLNREEISNIRRNEAATSVAILDGTYHCLENDDVFILYDRPTLLKAITLVRKVKPELVFTHSPSDYMLDHEITSKIAQTACFSCGMVNIKTEGIDAYDQIPYLYYLDPMEGKDILGSEIKPDTIIDISTVIDIKEKMLLCHRSQRDWLLKHHGMDEYLRSMKEFSAKRGDNINKKYGEGFRQHLGHAFPTDNILKNVLSDFGYILSV